ncbi:hypothetical protein D3C72_1965390 [compost metagenome]
MDQGRIHARFARHLADGDAIETVLGEEVFGGVEDGLAGLAGAGGLGLLGSAATGRRSDDGRQGRGEVVVRFHARKLVVLRPLVQRRHRGGGFAGAFSVAV